MKLNRIQEIEKYIRMNKQCKLEHLCEVFNVSMNTIRRDINELAKNGIVEKVYGGVVINDQIEKKEEALPLYKVEFSEELDKIGEMAASLVNDGDIILIGSGTTTYHMIRYLKDKKNLTVITNNILVITQALNYHNFRLVVLGGDVQRDTYSIVGLDSPDLLQNLNAHKVFIGASGISVDSGATNSAFFEAQIKQAMVKASNQTILLLDHNKFDKVSLYTFLDPQDIDIFITDQKPNEKYTNYFSENNIKVIFPD